jgi:hypothetical protein
MSYVGRVAVALRLMSRQVMLYNYNIAKLELCGIVPLSHTFTLST